MSSALERLMARFQAALAGAPEAEETIRWDIAPGSGLDPGARLGIYRHAYCARLEQALAESFGKTHSYLGDALFHKLAMDFIAATPSRHASLRWYGADFPAWLRTQLESYPVVAELAAFEWALAHAFDAADARTLDAEGLRLIAVKGWDGVGFVMQPSAQLLLMAWNAPAIWLALERGDAPPAAAKAPQPVSWLVWRKAMQPHFRSLDANEADALHCLQRGDSFAAVSQRLSERYADDDVLHEITAWLYGWLGEGLLSAVRFGGEHD